MREIDGTIAGTLEVELREKEKPQYQRSKSQVHRSRERHRQMSREKKVHSLRSHSVAYLNCSKWNSGKKNIKE